MILFAAAAANEPFWNITDADDAYLFFARLLIVIVAWATFLMFVSSWSSQKWRIVQRATRALGTFWSAIYAGFSTWTWITNFSSQPQWFRATYGLVFVFTLLSTAWCLHQAIYRKSRYHDYCPMHNAVQALAEAGVLLELEDVSAAATAAERDEEART
jgi:hypothetical protein